MITHKAPVSHRLFSTLKAVLLLMILVAWCIHGAQARPGALPLDAYWEQIAETHAFVNSLKEAPPDVAQAQLAALADRWERVTKVTLPNGDTIPVDHSFLVKELRADPPNPARLAALLTALYTAHQDRLTKPVPVLDQAALARILAQPAYQYQWQPDSPNPRKQLLERFQEWLWTLLDKLLANTSGGSTRALRFFYLLIGTGSLILLLVMAYVLRSMRAGFVADADLAQNGAANAVPLTSKSALAQAQTLSAAGDYREAVRYLYLSTLLLLDERGVLRYNPALTNREHLRSLQHQPGLAQAFKNVIDVFDRVWYGSQPLDAEDYADYAAHIERLHQQRGSMPK